MRASSPSGRSRHPTAVITATSQPTVDAPSLFTAARATPVQVCRSISTAASTRPAMSAPDTWKSSPKRIRRAHGPAIHPMADATTDAVTTSGATLQAHTPNRLRFSTKTRTTTGRTAFARRRTGVRVSRIAANRTPRARSDASPVAVMSAGRPTTRRFAQPDETMAAADLPRKPTPVPGIEGDRRQPTTMNGRKQQGPRPGRRHRPRCQAPPRSRGPRRPSARPDPPTPGLPSAHHRPSAASAPFTIIAAASSGIARSAGPATDPMSSRSIRPRTGAATSTRAAVRATRSVDQAPARTSVVPGGSRWDATKDRVASCCSPMRTPATAK